MQPQRQNKTRKIITIDCQYLRPQFAASYLVVDGDRALFIDNNTAHSVQLLLAALEKEGLTADQVDYVIITHVHLDHAGGTSLLMSHCPNATLLAHPRATPHMIDPSKLINSARQVYGPAAFEKLYGTLGAIPSARTRSMEDNEELLWQSGPLQFLHTRGHANHHFCIYEPLTTSIFTGDAFGLAYPEVQTNGLFIIPSTSPTDFDPAEAKKSIHRILNSGAQNAYLTHYGKVHKLQEAAQQLLEGLDFSESLLFEAINLIKNQKTDTGNSLATHCTSLLTKFYENKFKFPQELLKLDLELNGAGIAYTAKKKA